MIHKKLFWSASIKDVIAYLKFWNIATGQGDDYRTGY